MNSNKLILFSVAALIVVLNLCSLCSAKSAPSKLDNNNGGKQFLLAQGKETTPTDFVRLVVMRLVYGIAANMGLEERLSGAFNGAFVPPNAEDDYFGFDFGAGDDDDGVLDLFDSE